jgi:hypothetical protein
MRKGNLNLFPFLFWNENKNFIYSTGEKIKPSEWDFENRLPNDLMEELKEQKSQKHKKAIR